MSVNQASRDLELENEDLRARLAEAESVLQAIRRGEIDAVVVSSPQGERVFTLEGADHPYRLLVESMNEGAATLTPDGVILYGNRRLASLIGIPTTQLAGARLADWVVPQDRSRLEELVRNFNDGCASAELTLQAGSGATLPVHASFSSLVLDRARLCCAIITDLSLAKHHAAVQEAARQVREANERLREADQRKDEFLATLAHELRNPLAPIRAAAQVLKMLNPSDEWLNQARAMIERQVKHMARLVDDLMELSRITLGRIELQQHTESLATLLASVTDVAQAAMDAAGHHFTVELPDEPLLIDADATRLSQAISNILENAAKYTPPGGRVSLIACREADHAVIRIEDTGIGIAPEMVPRIFDMFVQADRSGQRAQNGLGIGLALSRRLIEIHGGTIEGSSRGLGHGSAFTIRLPLSRTEPAEEAAPCFETLPTVPPQRVLVVDDNPDAAESLRMLLELQGHRVLAVHDGAGALSAQEEFRPDLVLLDIGLPGMDGYEIARRFRARYGVKCPTLVALSGWGQPQDKQWAADAGVDAHFTKPLDPEVLARLLAERAHPTPAASGR